MTLFVILRPRKAESRLALNLIKDSGGKVIEKSSFGTIVQCKKSIGNTLDLIPIIRTQELDTVISR